jgi:hypothetical protein
LLGPLRRYLRSNVGRPWNKVYSEMKQHLDDRKTTGRHIFEHVEREVALHCYLGADGKVYQHDGWPKDQPVSGLYVHPRIGLLCWKDSKPVRRNVAAASLLTHLEDGWYRIKLDGIWYAVQLEYVGEIEAPRGGSYWSNVERVTKETFQQGRRVWRFKNKRQYSSKELKAAGLQNDALAA